MMNVLNDLTRNERRDLYAYSLSVAPWTTIPVTDTFSASAREIADALEYSDGAALYWDELEQDYYFHLIEIGAR